MAAATSDSNQQDDYFELLGDVVLVKTVKLRKPLWMMAEKSFLVQIKGVSKSEMASRPIKQASITLHWYLSSLN